MARRALLIGVSEYGQGFEALPGSLLDVRGMAAVLGNAEQGAFEVDALENPKRDEMARAVETFFQGRKKDDSLLLYFSGHGDVGPGFARQKLHFCAKGTYKSDGRLMKSSALSADFLKEQLDDCRAGQIVVILDCCHSGAIADLLRKGEGESAFAGLKAEGRVILASSSASDASWQEPGGLSFYTKYLLEGMAGPAKPEGAAGEWIVVRELHDYARQRLAVVQKGGKAPEIIVARDAGYELPLVRAPKLDPQLEYRRAVDSLFQKLDLQGGVKFDGEIQNPLARMSLDTLQQRLEREGLSKEIAGRIEGDVQAPYKRRAVQRQKYFQAFGAAVADGFLPTSEDRGFLADIRQNLLLGEEDASQIEQLIVQERQVKQRPMAAPTPPKPKPSAKPVTPKKVVRADVSSRPAAEPIKQQRQTQTATLPRKLRAGSRTVPGQPFPRRAFLRTLGFGGGGLGLVGVWRGLLNQTRVEPEVTVQPEGATVIVMPESKVEARPISWRSFEFEVMTVDKTGVVTERKLSSAKLFKENLGNGVELEMVRIPAGKFMMGSPEGEEGRDIYGQFNDAFQGVDVEGPQREVTVPEFAMGRFEVTQAQYEVVMGENPSEFKGEQRPVEQVSWNDAQAFCQKLSEKTGREYRLPSEAEWEYACRAGTTTPFHVGATITADLANYDASSTYAQGPKGLYRKKTTDVGSFLPNAFGLYDMHGNVFEWCADRWYDNYEGAPMDGSFWANDAEIEKYILRGGSWADLPWDCRSACRYYFFPGYRGSSLGFRVCCSAPRAV